MWTIKILTVRSCTIRHTLGRYHITYTSTPTAKFVQKKKGFYFHMSMNWLACQYRKNKSTAELVGMILKLELKFAHTDTFTNNTVWCSLTLPHSAKFLHVETDVTSCQHSSLPTLPEQISVQQVHRFWQWKLTATLSVYHQAARTHNGTVWQEALNLKTNKNKTKIPP